MSKQYKNKRKRKRKLRHKLAQKRLLSKKQTKPKAGDVLKYFQQYDPRKHSHCAFVLIARVSTVAQAIQGNLYTQHYRMEKFVYENKLDVVSGPYYVVNSAFWSGDSKELMEQRFRTEPKLYPNPRYFKPHYAFLKRLVGVMWETMLETGLRNVAFLFECVDRAIRSDDYSFENKDAQLTEKELEVFVEVMRPFPGIKPFPAITICHPLDTFNEIESWRKIYKDDFVPPNHPGWAKYYRKKLYSEVIRLKFVENKSLGQITEITGIAKSTVADQCNKIALLLEEYEK